MMGRQFDEEKFRELVLYIAERCQEHPFFGATKLNKILFFSDFIAYDQLGVPITGAEYTALEYGPGPRQWLPIKYEMLSDSEIKILSVGNQQRVLAQRSPNLERFSPGERGIVDVVIEALENKDAESVSSLSHLFLGWRAARAECLVTGATTTIPYETVHVSNESLSQSEVKEGQVLAERHSWSFE